MWTTLQTLSGCVDFRHGDLGWFMNTNGLDPAPQGGRSLIQILDVSGHPVPAEPKPH